VNSYDVKAYLRQLTRTDRRIDAMLERRERYEALAMKRTTSLTGMPAAQRTESSVEYFAGKLVDLSRDIDQMVDQYVDLTRKIEKEIDALPDDRHRDLLKWRYVNGWRWEQIADAMNYDKRQVYRMHGDALQAFEEKHSAAIQEFSAKRKDVTQCHFQM
jgi:hypothetical protein